MAAAAPACEHCVGGHTLPGEPRGTYVGSAYFAEAPASVSEEQKKKRAVVLLTDVFGLPLVNNRLMADKISDALGCDVWVPDMFAGSPPLSVNSLIEEMPDVPGQSMSLWLKLRFIIAIIFVIPKLLANRASVVDQRVTDLVNKIKAEKAYEKIGAVGYCFGGSVAIRFGATPVFDSIVVVHPGRCTLEEIKKIRVPNSWACAEEDMSFKPDLRNAAEASFKEREGKPDFVEYEFVDYPGTCHGFGVRPNLGIPHIKEAHEKCFKQTVGWFEKTLA